MKKIMELHFEATFKTTINFISARRRKLLVTSEIVFEGVNIIRRNHFFYVEL